MSERRVSQASRSSDEGLDRTSPVQSDTRSRASHDRAATVGPDNAPHRRNGADQLDRTTDPDDGRQDGVSLAEASERLGIAAEAVRKRIQRGTLTAFKRDGRWFVVLPDQSAKKDVNGIARGLAVTGQADVPMRTVRRTDQSSHEMLSWLRQLQEENRNLAGQLGYVQAQLDQANQALEALRHERPEPHTRNHISARMLEARIEQTDSTRSNDGRPWWRFWRG